MPEPLKILFVCGRNQRRSPTAERLYRGDPRVSVRSAGVSERSKHELSVADLEWADLVLVMERRYLTRIRSNFGAALKLPPIESLDIPDEFGAMEPELIELIRSTAEHHIESIKPSHSTDPAPGPVTAPKAREPQQP